jgi:hypothetical protein
VTLLWLSPQQEAPDASEVTAGWTGLIVLVLLAVATAFLLRSMNKRLKGIDFDGDRSEDERDDDPPDR